jgi:hypothetical protein
VANLGHGKLWWWILAARGYFEFPLGFWGFYIVPAVALGVGIVSGLRTRATAPIAAMAGTPMVLLLIASSLGKYPITTGIHEVRSRFVLFTVASVFLLVAMGISRLCDCTRFKKAVALPLIASLLIPSLFGGFAGPRFRGQELRPLIAHLQHHLGPGDHVYVFHASVPAFRYYTRDQPMPAVLGRSPGPRVADLAADIRRLEGDGRLWVLASHTYNGERKIIRRTLRRMGRLGETRRAPGAVLFRCQMDPRTRSSATRPTRIIQQTGCPSPDDRKPPR